MVGDVVNPTTTAAWPTEIGLAPPPSPVEPVGEPRWLTEVRVRAARRVLWLRHLWFDHHYEGEHLLAISHSEIDRALVPPPVATEAEQHFYRTDDQAGALTRELADLGSAPGDARFDHLAGSFDLAPLELALLQLAAATAVDPALGRVFGYLLDRTGPAPPTPALATALFELPAHEALGPASALVRWALLDPVLAGEGVWSPSTGWRLDAPLARTLIDSSPSSTSWSVGCQGSPVVPARPVLRPRLLDELIDYVQALGPATGSLPLEIELVGPPGSGRATLAAQVAEHLGSSLVAVDALSVVAASDPSSAGVRELRRARLEGATVAWHRADALPPDVLAALPPSDLAFYLVATPLAAPPRPGTIRRSVRCLPISRRERLGLWSSLTDLAPPTAVAEWALRPAEVVTAARVAPAGDQRVGDVCRRLLLEGTPDLVAAMPLPYEWEDIVLSPLTATHLRELEAQATDRGQVLDDWGFARLTPLGRGATALFAGPSGTGKTMAAQVLARSLGLELLRVDLAGVVSKYIGETEKHLRELFDACERAPVVLFFDEADALFGKRTQVNDAHDRYANIEIDYVLQRMEQFDGLAILATNRKGDLDTAFVRRLRFIVDFRPPSLSEREQLWRLALEGAHDLLGEALVGELDWSRLAQELDLTGAGIKSAALAAAFLARSDGTRIAEHHVMAAARRELEKQGVVLRTGQLESR